MLTFVPEPLEVMLPRLMKFGVVTFKPEPVVSEEPSHRDY